jgi:DegV family protein with EDD domain
MIDLRKGKRMTFIKIVTDSTADIPAHIVKELGITVVPLKVHFEKETFLDGVTIQPEQFYQKLETAESLPTTSQPSPINFVETFKELVQDVEGDVQIISIHLSSALSGTVQSAKLAQSMLEEHMDITVIDSKKASYAIGIIVIAVAKAAREGKSKEECISLAHYLIKESAVYFLVDSLTYLQKGGRIGKASAVLGSLLNIKPILSLDEQGEVFAMDKVRGNKKALLRIIQLLKEFSGDHQVHLGISHAASPDEAQEMVKALKQDFQVKDEVITDIGPVIGTHVGPKTIAIMMIKA